jgi:hypothetical protein
MRGKKHRGFGISPIRKLINRQIFTSDPRSNQAAKREDAAYAASNSKSFRDGILNPWKIYYSIRNRYLAHKGGDPRVEMVPIEDAIQEISLALLEKGGILKDGTIVVEWKKENFAHGKNALLKMCEKYGYGQRHKKELSLQVHDSENGDLFGAWSVDHSEESSLSEIQQKTVKKILSWYDNHLTVREICERLGVEYTHSKQTAMNRLFPRNQKRGGQRNRKGSLRFICCVCGYARTNNKLKNHVSQCERRCSHCGIRTLHDVSLYCME